MSTRFGLLAAAFCAAVSLLVAPSGAGHAGLFAPRPIASFWLESRAFLSGQWTNVVAGEQGLSLDRQAGFERDGGTFGYFISPVEALDDTFDRVRLTRLDLAAGAGRAEVEVRSSTDATAWTSWTALKHLDEEARFAPGRFFQYRVELIGDSLGQPTLRGLGFQLATIGAAPAPQSGENPTVRVFATREGLVGRRTANGHLIVERDRFVALPSKKALNADGKKDYQVKLVYKGKSATVPVWDVGPWNVRDNYWDEQREIFPDLPRFVPQAFAAWKDNHNGGRDHFGRWVTFPASIDIADGTFLDDLGMRNSDYVDVTFLWLTAPSPPKAETPPVLGLKTEGRDLASSAPAPTESDDSTWYFADGSTLSPFETYYTLFNTGEQRANARLTFMTTDGGTVTHEVSIPASQRATIAARQLMPEAEFALKIQSAQPLVAERAMYFGGDGHSTVGATAPSTTWYVPDGSTQAPFETWLVLQNPSATTANLVITLLKDDGENHVSRRSVPPTSRASFNLNEIAPNSAFSAKVVSDQPVVVERSTYLANGGGLNTLGATQASNTWYFAEGNVRENAVDTWILVQNPGRSPASVTVTLLRENGKTATEKLAVGAASKAALNAKSVISSGRFGIKIEADQPVVAERAMYFGGGKNGSGTGAHASVGASQLAKDWIVADGGTMAPFREQILIANPGSEAARVKIQYLIVDGESKTREYDVDEMSRLTIDVSAEVPDAGVSAKVTADRPIVVERSVYFGSSGGTNSLAVPR